MPATDLAPATARLKTPPGPALADASARRRGVCGTDETATGLEKSVRRWPRGARVGDLRRQPQMAHEARDHRGIFSHGDQPEAAGTPGTREHVNPEAPAHQLRPETIGPLAPVLRTRHRDVRGRGRTNVRRRPKPKHKRPPGGSWRQHPVIEDQVDTGARRERREALEQLSRGGAGRMAVPITNLTLTGVV